MQRRIVDSVVDDEANVFEDRGDVVGLPQALDL
jgi:hypothetical protein